MLYSLSGSHGAREKPVVTYGFKYTRGSKKGSHVISAKTGAEAFREIARFLKKKEGRKLVPGSIRIAAGAYEDVINPPDIFAYLEHVTKEEGVAHISKLAQSKFRIPKGLKKR